MGRFQLGAIRGNNSWDSRIRFFWKNVDVSEDGNRVLGSSLSLNGFTGEVRIYDWNGSSWDTVGQSIIGEYAGDGCGSSAAISADGTTLVVGSSESQGGGDLRGSARVFKLVGNSWLQVDATIYGIADYETVGYTTAISATGETVAVASPLSSLHSTFGGVVRVYEGGVLNTESFSSLNEVTAYPVPARENINIALEQEYGEVTVVQYNVLGKEMNRLKAVGKTKIDFPLKGNPGIYFITISTENSSKTIKIVKE